ncbi:MAG: PEGA domain-containing protein [Lentisphaerae bacterium]|jgi:hypothetical protein|nr:PEGA domain-containing protein [Lentisphaerota bacterium]
MKKLLLAAIAASLAVAAQAQELQTVAESETRDLSSSPELQAFRNRVAAAHPELQVVGVDEKVVRQAVLAPLPPKRAKPAVMAIFVKNNSTTRGLDDQVDGIRDRLAAEVAGIGGFTVMDSNEIVAAFNRYKVSTAEERNGLIDGLFTGGSVTRVAQMIEADYVLLASINGASNANRVAGDRPVTVYTLRMTTKVLDATTGGTVFGKNWVNRQGVPVGNGDNPLAIYDDLVDRWTADTAEELAADRPSWPEPVKETALASFTVKTTLDAYFRPLEITVDAEKPIKDDLRVVAGGITVELDGAAIGSSGGTFKARPGTHQLKVSRQWMQPWVKTVYITDGAVFDVALELSPAGFERYKAKDSLKAELALAYAEAAFKRGCRVNFDTEAWQTVTWAPGADATSVSSSTMVQPPAVVAPVIQAPASPAVEAPQE